MFEKVWRYAGQGDIILQVEYKASVPHNGRSDPVRGLEGVVAGGEQVYMRKQATAAQDKDGAVVCCQGAVLGCEALFQGGL